MNRMTREQARNVRAKGHEDAREFALLIGLPDDYQNDPKAKKDVIDKNGDAHSVKSGKLKWQIFLYKKSRFDADPHFAVMNGIGKAMSNCLACFPDNREDYEKDKIKYKELLRPKMRKLNNLFGKVERRRAFFEKSFFNGNEVRFLTIKHDNIFHVFANSDVVASLGQKILTKNSTAKTAKQVSEQKVVFYTEATIGEIEIRRDPNHYVAAKFWMFKGKTLALLQQTIGKPEKWHHRVYVYGKAVNLFKKEHKEYLRRKNSKKS